MPPTRGSTTPGSSEAPRTAGLAHGVDGYIAAKAALQQVIVRGPDTEQLPGSDMRSSPRCATSSAKIPLQPRFEAEHVVGASRAAAALDFASRCLSRSPPALAALALNWAVDRVINPIRISRSGSA